VLLSISFRRISVWSGVGVVEIPADCSSSNNERTSLYKEEHSPEQVKDMDYQQNLDFQRGFEVLEGVLVELVAGGS